MRGILDHIRGTVRLEISGPGPERMLNLLAGCGIAFSRADRSSEQGISLTLLRRDAVRVTELARRAGFGCRQLQSRGGPAPALFLRSRIMLCILPPILLLAVFTLSLFIWEIEISGSETLSDAQVLAALEENGIARGTFGPTLDRELLRDRMIETLPRISWMTVNVKGCRAEVLIRERVLPPEIIDSSVPADIIAAKTGMICEMSVFEGKGIASRGDTVLQGELLISGVVPNLAGGTRFVRSQGVVKARTWYEISEKMPLEYVSKRYTGRVIRKKSLIIGNYRLNLYLNGGIPLDDCDKIIYEERFSLAGAMLLPLASVTAEYREYIAEPARMSEDDAASILKLRLAERLREQTRGEPVSMEFDTCCDGEYITVTLRAECVEDIGQAVSSAHR